MKVPYFSSVAPSLLPPASVPDFTFAFVIWRYTSLSRLKLLTPGST
jgi:hypothetical protein